MTNSLNKEVRVSEEEKKGIESKNGRGRTRRKRTRKMRRRWRSGEGQDAIVSHYRFRFTLRSLRQGLAFLAHEAARPIE
ncbi:hypothetical protein PoB_001920200 [Plakobranchus ocellatus]|uniref:Uncharacterized protein n=1 Tax=Plakobranchus ocellatus TaxID=259542 RepID=A0AAV3ZDZ2_9GAST|nr:hypothetical protein PoB_001920200 [Plakobranchus ocellatus]